jgi:hypothetical protein
MELESADSKHLRLAEDNWVIFSPHLSALKVADFFINT